MVSLKDVSIRTKLILLTTICAALVLILSTAAFVIYNVATIRESKVEQLRSQARMLAFNSTAVLTFRDSLAGEQLLTSLQLHPAVEVAGLYDSSGECISTYQRAGQEELPPHILRRQEGYRFTSSGYLELCEQVIDGDEVVGTLFLRSNMTDLQEKLQAYAKIVITVLLCGLAAAVVLALLVQKAIAVPIENLARTAQEISSAEDYSIRVDPKSNDEIGLLYRSFNQMLDQVQTSRQALRSAVANMSHEIRTPINAILGFAELLLKGADEGDPRQRQDYLQTIVASGKHLLDLINDILDFSKIESGQLELEMARCSPHRIIAEVTSVLRVRAQEQRLSLEYEWGTPIPESIMTDEGRLRQMLINLVGNAIKFTYTGGVHIVARMTGTPKRPQLAIDVIDSGIGIPSDKLQHIFQPFVQADNTVTRRFGGTGLGLAITRQIAAKLGGELTVHSELGKGSTFTITIDVGSLDGVPVLSHPQADVAQSRAITRPMTPPNLPGVRILVVEDGSTNRKLIRLILARSGAHVTLAENGKIGLELALKQEFDVILMDMQMPVMDGYTATTKLRDLGVKTPVIALTAHAMKGDEQRCRDAGCSVYLTKPIDGEKLLNTVADTLQGELGQSEPAAKPAEPATIPNPLISSLPLDDPEFCDIAREFVDRALEQSRNMRRAWESQDLDSLADLAHWFKGAAGTAGYHALTEPSRKLERMVKDRDLDHIEPALVALTDLIERLQAPENANEQRLSTPL
jgi:two-component system, sensor histidine kinase